MVVAGAALLACAAGTAGDTGVVANSPVVLAGTLVLAGLGAAVRGRTVGEVGALGRAADSWVGLLFGFSLPGEFSIGGAEPA